jgi:hypothetical protein
VLRSGPAWAGQAALAYSLAWSESPERNSTLVPVGSSRATDCNSTSAKPCVFEALSMDALRTTENMGWSRGSAVVMHVYAVVTQL